MVLMKYVPDTEVKIKLDSQDQLDQSGFRFTINPYDEFAIEEAVQIAEKKISRNPCCLCGA
jgi:electron transfer flavoprotein alpha/beta subunit